jgi:hypothetical protein
VVQRKRPGRRWLGSLRRVARTQSSPLSARSQRSDRRGRPTGEVGRQRFSPACAERTPGCWGDVWMLQEWETWVGTIAWIYVRENGWCGGPYGMTWLGGPTFADWE